MEKRRSCQDCRFICRVRGGGTPVVVINDATKKRYMSRGQDNYYAACSKGYWGGVIQIDEYRWRGSSSLGRTATIGRNPDSFTQVQAYLCADFEDQFGQGLCTQCRVEVGVHPRSKGADMLCEPCRAEFDKLARRRRHWDAL